MTLRSWFRQKAEKRAEVARQKAARKAWDRAWNEAWRDGRSANEYAYEGDFSMALHYIRKGANPNVTERLKFSQFHSNVRPLPGAEVQSQGAGTAALGGPSWTEYDHGEWNIGFSAIGHGRPEVLREFLDRGLDPSLTRVVGGFSKREQSLLEYALELKDEVSAVALVHAGADVKRILPEVYADEGDELPSRFDVPLRDFALESHMYELVRAIDAQPAAARPAKMWTPPGVRASRP